MALPSQPVPPRPRSTLLSIFLLWAIFYASFTLVVPPLLDDADSVHAEVAREMLLRHDYVTLYANGIRYLEKAPLLYWSMALSFKLFGVSTAAARIPLALTILALALTVEAFARRAFRSACAGLYAALVLLSSPGIFLFTRITIPDAMVCLWLTLALYAFYLTETAGVPHSSQLHRDEWDVRLPPHPVPAQTPVILSEAKSAVEEPVLSLSKEPAVSILPCLAFAACCALNVLTKGLIGLVFPIAIVLIYLLLTRGLANTVSRIRELHPLSSLALFLLIAAPWHILIAIANPTQGHPGPLTFTLFPTTGQAHWHVPLPTDGNVHGWLWFYFVNEQLLRYLNLRVPRDYDTVPLSLFWGLCLIWLFPWSTFAFKALPRFIPAHSAKYRRGLLRHTLDPRMRAWLLLGVWAAVVLLFFLFSTRQEYYVLPAFPPIAMLISGWLSLESRVALPPVTQNVQAMRRTNLRITAVLLTLGSLFALATLYFLLHTHTPTPSTDLAQLLQQNPADYALSMGHFLDLNTAALSLFRLPLALAALSLFLGPLASYILRRNHKPHAATVALAAGAFGFLLAAHLGLQTFAPVLTSQPLAAIISSQLKPNDLIVIHGEYEAASSLGFYLQRNDLHILEGRSSNLWYGSFFPDAPPIFETRESLAKKWSGPQRIFLWQDLSSQPSPLPSLPSPAYLIAKSGGKAIFSNQP